MDKKIIADLLKRFPCTIKPNGNIVTCPVRLSFPYLFKPRMTTQDGQPSKLQFSTSLLFPLGADLSILRKAAEAAALEKFGQQWAKRKVNMPFRDQGERVDADGNMPAGYIDGAVFINVSANEEYPPAIRLRDLSPAAKADIYPGVWALVSLRGYAYDNPQRKGVSFGLQNVLKLMDDDKLGGGRSSVESDFAPITGMEDADAMFAGGAEAHDFG